MLFFRVIETETLIVSSIKYLQDLWWGVQQEDSNEQVLDSELSWSLVLLARSLSPQIWNSILYGRSRRCSGQDSTRSIDHLVSQIRVWPKQLVPFEEPRDECLLLSCYCCCPLNQRVSLPCWCFPHPEVQKLKKSGYEKIFKDFMKPNKNMIWKANNTNHISIQIEEAAN